MAQKSLDCQKARLFVSLDLFFILGIANKLSIIFLASISLSFLSKQQIHRVVYPHPLILSLEVFPISNWLVLLPLNLSLDLCIFIARLFLVFDYFFELLAKFGVN